MNENDDGVSIYDNGGEGKPLEREVTGYCMEDLLRIGEELDAVVLVQVLEDLVGEAESLLAGDLHRTMPFSLASFRFTILNISL